MDSIDSSTKMMKRLNLNYLSLSNSTYAVGIYDLLHVLSPSIAEIDYLALYGHPDDYDKTRHTAVCFYENDASFDGFNGLWNAIYYGRKNLLNGFKTRFRNVKLFVSPDYTLGGDLPLTFNLHNIQRSRLVSLWLVEECDKLVIPSVTYSNEDSLEYALDGLEDCRIVAFSTKGSMKRPEQIDLLLKAVKKTVNSLLCLRKIVAYSVVPDDCKTLDLFEYATKRGIEVVIPNNILKSRNVALRGARHGKI